MLNQKIWKKKNIATNQDVTEVFKKYNPTSKFAPGTSYEYSNTGYLILASIIEKVSAMKLLRNIKSAFRNEKLEVLHLVIYKAYNLK